MKEMPEKIDKVIKEIVNGINNILENKSKKILLYGSYARGDFNENSDIDIIILTDIPEEELYEYFSKISDMTYDIELENDVIVSIILKNIEKFNYWNNTLPFYMNIKKEGILLSE